MKVSLCETVPLDYTHTHAKLPTSSSSYFKLNILIVTGRTGANQEFAIKTIKRDKSRVV